VYGLAELFHLYIRADSAKRNQLSYFSISMLVAYIGGVPNFLPTFNIEIPLLMPFGTYAIPVYALFTAYAIVAYRLMDIEIIIRRTVVFAGLVGFVFGVFSAAAFLVREVLSDFIGMSDAWTYAISIVLIVLGYDPIRRLLVNMTDRYLFQRKYDYQKLLKDASKGIAAIESLSHLLNLVVHFITMRMRVKNAAVLTRTAGNSDFKLGYERGYKKTYLEYTLGDPNPLIQYLSHEKEAMDVERVKEYIETGRKAKKKGQHVRYYDFAAIKKQMEELEAACCVPSFLGQELRSILVLGEKKSGDYYTDEDLNVLFTLAQESAIAIENARLYDEAINKTRELERINRQLEFAKLRLTKALQETEAANKQLQDTQAQLIHEQKMATLGRLAASVGHEVNNPLTILSMNVSRAILKYRKNPDLRVSEIMEIFQKMEQNISRIKAVVNTLTGLLKKSEKGKFEPLSLKLILEETLPLVQFQTYLDNLVNPDVEFNVPGNIPLVRGDLERLQEVFLNLFINAYHAMSGRLNPHIAIHAEIDPDDPHRVAIHFSDNGQGMSEDTMKKIFNYGFTTKPPGRGSGMGLYMCKYIIELHGGTISVSSKLGQGTTFTLTLPVYEEATMSGAAEQATAS
jgi:signal transduction histidine kinase